MNKLRDEFVVTLGNHKLYRIEDLDYFDDILIEENQQFWRDVARGYAMIFLQKTKRYESDPELVPVGKLPVTDVIKKYG